MMNRSFFSPLLYSSLLLSILLTGCALGPDYQRPDTHLPENYRITEKMAANPAPAASAESPLWSTQNWRQVFTDKDLQILIEEALKNGPDARLAVARVREAAAIANSSANLLPQINLSLNTSPVPKQSGETLSSSFSGGIGISWEIDLWGRYRRSNEAEAALLLSSEAARLGINASLVADIARFYYQLSMLHESYAVTTTSAANQREVLSLIQRLSAAGLSSAAEERQQESVLGATEANLPKIRQQIVETENTLSVLIGRHPGAIRFDSPPELALPGFIPPGLPSALLERRPDLQQAEAELIAANARIGEAKAMFFPSLSLTGILGGISGGLSDLLLGRAPTVASLGPNLIQPLFYGGQLRFNAEAVDARHEQTLIRYQKAILNALGEVATALSAYENSEERLSIQKNRVRVSREALRLAELRFKSGVTSLLEVLDTQRQLLLAETDALQSLFERRSALIQLYLALGGGWDELQPLGEREDKTEEKPVDP